MRTKVGTIRLSQAVVFQRVLLDAMVDQARYDVENERGVCQLMPESLHQNLKYVQLRHRMFDHNAV